jgi:hypothetical protein
VAAQDAIGPGRRRWHREGMEEVELHQLDLRHEDLRIHEEAQRRRLLTSVAEIGQQVPAIVIEQDEHLLLIDGYLRVEVLRRLGRDTVQVTRWQVTEAEALLHHHHLATASRSALEDGWLLSRLRWHGMALDELARRLCRSKSWVSRRLALVDELVTPAQEAVRTGQLPAQAAMKYLVPLSRANRRQCGELIAGLGGARVSVREVGVLYQAWRRADSEGRQFLATHPLLLLRAAQEPTAENDDASASLHKDLTMLAVIARRSQRRAHEGGPWTAEQEQAWRGAADAFASLRAVIEEKQHAGSVDTSEHPDVA